MAANSEKNDFAAVLFYTYIKKLPNHFGSF